MRLVILQAGYMPWLGFFDQMHKADLFVCYDDVQFDKHGWRNRNRIRIKDGWMWLSVPVFSRGKPMINEVLINQSQNWRKKHLSSLRQNYTLTPFFDKYYCQIEKIVLKGHEKLLDLNVALVTLFRKLLNIDTPVLYSSALSSKGKGTERLVRICKELGADTYLSGDAGREYLDEKLFSNNGICLEYHDYRHPVYTQAYPSFIPYLSVVDLLFNHGDKSLEIIHGKASDYVSGKCNPNHVVGE